MNIKEEYWLIEIDGEEMEWTKNRKIWNGNSARIIFRIECWQQNNLNRKVSFYYVSENGVKSFLGDNSDDNFIFVKNIRPL